MDDDPMFGVLPGDVLLSAAVVAVMLGLAGLGAWHVLGWLAGWW